MQWRWYSCKAHKRKRAQSHRTHRHRHRCKHSDLARQIPPAPLRLMKTPENHQSVIKSSPHEHTMLRSRWQPNSMARLAAGMIATSQQPPTGSSTTERGCFKTGEGVLGMTPEAGCGHWGLTWRAVSQKALLAHL